MEEIWDNNGQIIGRVGGIILNNPNIKKEEFIESIIFGIERLKDENIEGLIIEEFSFLDKKSIELIDKSTNLKVFNGIKVLFCFLPLVLNKIYSKLGEDLKEKEVLIIGDEEEITKEIIQYLCKEVKFITLAGDYDSIIDNISKDILEMTGLSIFYSKNIDRILTNYSIIINLKENCYLNLKRLRKEAVVFDFSIGRGISNIMRDRSIKIIEDFIFRIDGEDLKENSFIESLVPSYIYEYFFKFKSENLAGLLVNGEIYTIQDFIDYEIRNKGKM